MRVLGVGGIRPESIPTAVCGRLRYWSNRPVGRRAARSVPSRTPACRIRR